MATPATPQPQTPQPQLSPQPSPQQQPSSTANNKNVIVPNSKEDYDRAETVLNTHRATPTLSSSIVESAINQESVLYKALAQHTYRPDNAPHRAAEAYKRVELDMQRGYIRRDGTMIRFQTYSIFDTMTTTAEDLMYLLLLIDRHYLNGAFHHTLSNQNMQFSMKIRPLKMGVIGHLGFKEHAFKYTMVVSSRVFHSCDLYKGLVHLLQHELVHWIVDQLWRIPLHKHSHGVEFVALAHLLFNHKQICSSLKQENEHRPECFTPDDKFCMFPFLHSPVRKEPVAYEKRSLMVNAEHYKKISTHVLAKTFRLADACRNGDLHTLIHCVHIAGPVCLIVSPHCEKSDDSELPIVLALRYNQPDLVTYALKAWPDIIINHKYCIQFASTTLRMMVNDISFLTLVFLCCESHEMIKSVLKTMDPKKRDELLSCVDSRNFTLLDWLFSLRATEDAQELMELLDLIVSYEKVGKNMQAHLHMYICRCFDNDHCGGLCWLIKRYPAQVLALLYPGALMKMGGDLPAHITLPILASAKNMMSSILTREIANGCCGTLMALLYLSRCCEEFFGFKCKNVRKSVIEQFNVVNTKDNMITNTLCQLVLQKGMPGLLNVLLYEMPSLWYQVDREYVFCLGSTNYLSSAQAQIYRREWATQEKLRNLNNRSPLEEEMLKASIALASRPNAYDEFEAQMPILVNMSSWWYFAQQEKKQEQIASVETVEVNAPVLQKVEQVQEKQAVTNTDIVKVNTSVRVSTPTPALVQMPVPTTSATTVLMKKYRRRFRLSKRKHGLVFRRRFVRPTFSSTIQA